MGRFEVAGRRVVVVGAARSGIAAAELLARRGARVTLSEMKPSIPEAARLETRGVTLELGKHGERTFREADLVVLSPGVPADHPAVQDARERGIEVIGEIELASRWLRGPLIAVTGTKGKSTTTALIGRMVEASGRPAIVGGNIGDPLSAQVEASTSKTVHVVETSSFQLETTTAFHPWMAVVTNFSPDHLDRHPSLEVYREAKARIFANQEAQDWAVVNADDPEVVRMASATRATRVWCSIEARVPEGFVLAGDAIVKRTATADIPLIPVSAVELTGRHMLANVLTAAAAAHIVGVTPAQMRTALEGFHGLPHVMEPVGEVGGVRFVNDSKATNVDAARRSIESFTAGVVAIVGGKYKGGDFRNLREPLQAHGRAVIAIGEARSLVTEALGDLLPVTQAQTMAEAVEQAWWAARPDGVVVLAPACSSFDMFVDYADRGRVFKEEVGRLARSIGSMREQ